MRFLSRLRQRLHVLFNRRHDRELQRHDLFAFRHAEDLLQDLRGALRYFGRNRVFVFTGCCRPRPACCC